MKLYGIWRWDADPKGEWLREFSTNPGNPILAYEAKQAACDRAAEHMGFDTYTQAKRAGWVEVKRLA